VAAAEALVRDGRTPAAAAAAAAASLVLPGMALERIRVTADGAGDAPLSGTYLSVWLRDFTTVAKLGAAFAGCVGTGPLLVAWRDRPVEDAAGAAAPVAATGLCERDNGEGRLTSPVERPPLPTLERKLPGL
jgi:shikimate kinase